MHTLVSCGAGNPPQAEEASSGIQSSDIQCVPVETIHALHRRFQAHVHHQATPTRDRTLTLSMED